MGAGINTVPRVGLLRFTPQPKDAEVVFANFQDHHAAEPERGTLAKWKNWVRRERAPTSVPSASAGVTVPGRAGPDPELLRIKAESAKAVPPPAEVRERLQALRKPAAEDADPWQGIDLDVFLEAADWLFDDETLRIKSDVYVGTFYLLIAHALEDE